jgi:hypothetical protein
MSNAQALFYVGFWVVFVVAVVVGYKLYKD